MPQLAIRLGRVRMTPARISGNLAIRWMRLPPFIAEGHRVNDMVQSGDGVVRSIYGDAKYDRLVGLKRMYDPDVFRLNQNIRP